MRFITCCFQHVFQFSSRTPHIYFCITRFPTRSNLPPFLDKLHKSIIEFPYTFNFTALSGQLLVLASQAEIPQILYLQKNACCCYDFPTSVSYGYLKNASYDCLKNVNCGYYAYSNGVNCGCYVNCANYATDGNCVIYAQHIPHYQPALLPKLPSLIQSLLLLNEKYSLLLLV